MFTNSRVPTRARARSDGGRAGSIAPAPRARSARSPGASATRARASRPPGLDQCLWAGSIFTHRHIELAFEHMHEPRAKLLQHRALHAQPAVPLEAIAIDTDGHGLALRPLNRGVRFSMKARTPSA